MELDFVPIGVKIIFSHKMSKCQCKTLFQTIRNWVKREKDFSQDLDQRGKRKIKWSYGLTQEKYVALSRAWEAGRAQNYCFQEGNKKQDKLHRKEVEAEGTKVLRGGAGEKSTFVGLLVLSIK